MKRIAIAVLILAACTATPPPASTPPPPVRPENAAVAAGVIRDASGSPVPRAAIAAWAADGACNVTGNPQTAVSGEDGTYEIRVERGVGPQFDGCIVLEARAGGAIARTQQAVRYAPNPASIAIDLTLLPATLLTRTEADRQYVYELRGGRGPTRVTIVQDALTRIALQ